VGKPPVDRQSIKAHSISMDRLVVQGIRTCKLKAQSDTLLRVGSAVVPFCFGGESEKEKGW